MSAFGSMIEAVSRMIVASFLVHFVAEEHPFEQGVESLGHYPHITGKKLLKFLKDPKLLQEECCFVDATVNVLTLVWHR